MSILRRHTFENILNCRDIGGYPTQHGSTQFGRFLRCGIVNTPDDWEIEKLNMLGVKTAIDLRGACEVEETPLRLERLDGADIYNLPLFEFNVATNEGIDLELAETYAIIIDNYKENIAKILNIIAEAKEGVILYNCFFGKDRTGILTMLLLSIAGVSKEDIIADYQQTYTYVKPYIQSHGNLLWDVNSEKHYSLPETMETLIEKIEKKYGSVINYIRSAGVSDETINTIKKRLCEG
ncbi:MAG: tyrosine-protein phosphatase [Clostridia bacterium]|nr:tyrosine-protein phosphatase [Clostridia bacterium]